MRLSKNFTREEFTASNTAARLGIDNSVPAALMPNLRDTARRAQQVRDFLGKPMWLSSGYRCPALNELVGGSDNSAHSRARAIDFTCDEFGTPLQVCRAIAKSGIPFDQLIHEFGRWVHIGFDPAMRGELLTIYRVGRKVRTVSGLKAIPA